MNQCVASVVELIAPISCSQLATVKNHTIAGPTRPASRPMSPCTTPSHVQFAVAAFLFVRCPLTDIPGIPGNSCSSMASPLPDSGDHVFRKLLVGTGQCMVIYSFHTSTFVDLGSNRVPVALLSDAVLVWCRIFGIQVL
ncbi:uncharacterized protein LOC135393029 isoform X2 [Ornithodoros turicata]|uniref:uncharacterized protein LOC135393029 isoform X2 n=1 Tax=Ornithodoros turicata TaxID=34597 RepID=UPI0031387AFE